MKRIAIAVLIFFALAGTALGQNGVIVNDQVQGPSGLGIAGATITVCTSAGTGTPCTPTTPIYTSSALTTTLSNPTITDAHGNFSFWIAPGTYIVTITGTGLQPFTKTITPGCIPGATGCAGSNLLPLNNTWTGTEAYSAANPLTVTGPPRGANAFAIVQGAGGGITNGAIEIYNELYTSPDTNFPLGNDLVVMPRGPADLWITGTTIGATTTASLSIGVNANVLVSAVNEIAGDGGGILTTGTTALFAQVAGQTLIVGRITANAESLTWSASGCATASTWSVVDGTHLCLNVAKTHSGTTDIEQGPGNNIQTRDIWMDCNAEKPSQLTAYSLPCFIKDINGNQVAAFPSNTGTSSPNNSVQFFIPVVGTNFTDSALTSGNLVQAGAGGLLQNVVLPTTLTAPGIFNNNASSVDNFKVTIGSACPEQTLIGGAFTTNVYTSCIVTPTSGVTNGFSVGYNSLIQLNDPNNGGQFGKVEGVPEIGTCWANANNTRCENADTMISTTGHTGILLYGREVNVETSNSSDTGAGILFNTSGATAQSTSLPASEVQANSKFTAGLQCDVAALPVLNNFQACINLLEGGSGASQLSQQILFHATTAGNVDETLGLIAGTDASGGEFLATTNGGGAYRIYLSSNGFMSNGTQTISGCGLTAAVGGSSAGKFTSGTTGTCTVTITPGFAAINGFYCSGMDLTTPADSPIKQSATTTTTCTLSSTTVTGDVITWMAIAF